MLFGMLVNFFFSVDNKRVLSVASPPHLYSSPTNTQPSVITRLVRPGHNVPFSSGK